MSDAGAGDATGGPPAAGATATTRARVSTLLALLLLAAGLRAFGWWRALMMMNDGPDFIWQAQRLLDGEWALALSHPYHPLYAAVAAALSLTGLDLVTSALCVSIAGGLAVVVAAWGLARHAFPDRPRVPAAAALVAALANRFVEFTSDVQSDGLFIGLAMLGLLALVAAADAGGCRRRLLAAGLLTGSAYLVRPEGLFLGLAALLWAAGGQAALRRKLAGLLVFGGAVLLCVVPYVLALHACTGVWGLSLKPSLQFVGLNDAATIQRAPAGAPIGWPYVPAAVSPRTLRKQAEAEADALPPAHALEQPAPAVKQGAMLAWPDLLALIAARNDWQRALGITLEQFVGALRPELLLFVLPGAVLLWRGRRRLLTGLAALVAGWLAVTVVHVHASDYVTNRHFLMAIGPLLPLAGAGLVAFWGHGSALRVVAVLALLVMAIAGSNERRADNGPRLAALAWVAEHTTPEQGFATHRRRDGFYAGRLALSTRMPVDDAVFARCLAEHHIAYLVFDEDKLASDQPHWLEQGLVREVQRFEGDGDTVLVLTAHFR